MKARSIKYGLWLFVIQALKVEKGLQFVHMDIHLWEWNCNATFIECVFTVFEGVKINIPIRTEVKVFHNDIVLKFKDNFAFSA